MEKYHYFESSFGGMWAICLGNKFLYYVDSKQQAQRECRKNNALTKKLEAAE